MLSNVVRALTLHGTRLDLLAADLAGFTALESLAVDYSRAADADIHVIAAACRHLTGLELGLSDEKRHGSAGITDVGLESISKILPHLRKLHIRDCPSITDSGMRPLAVGCPLLEDFGVHNCPNLSVRCAREILTTCPEVRRLHCQQRWSCHWLHPSQTATFDLSRLEALELYLPDDAGVASAAMAILSSSCVPLRELHVHTPHPHFGKPDPLVDCPPMPALVKLTMMEVELRIPSFMAFLTNAPRLERVRLEDCGMIGEAQALPATLSLRSLECRSLYTEPEDDFWRCGAWCPKLTSLVTIESHGGSGILASSLAGCSRLVTLRVGPFSRYRRKHLAWTCPPLGALRTLICWRVHWQDLAAIAKASPLLQEVRLRDCHTVEWEIFLGLLSWCPELCYIRILRGCSALSSGLIDSLANGFRILRGNVYEVVHLETVDGDWGLDWGGCDLHHIETICTTYRVHRSVQGFHHYH
eukprot:SM000204S05855  [mRNA]  locus=s204:224849:226410:- [translate_table: standard]